MIFCYVIVAFGTMLYSNSSCIYVLYLVIKRISEMCEQRAITQTVWLSTFHTSEHASNLVRLVKGWQTNLKELIKLEWKQVFNWEKLNIRLICLRLIINKKDLSKTLRFLSKSVRFFACSKWTKKLLYDEIWQNNPIYIACKQFSL